MESHTSSLSHRPQTWKWAAGRAPPWEHLPEQQCWLGRGALAFFGGVCRETESSSKRPYYKCLKPLLSLGTQLIPPLWGAAGAQHQPEQPRGRHKGKCPQCRSGCVEQVCAVCALSHCSC